MKAISEAMKVTAALFALLLATGCGAPGGPVGETNSEVLARYRPKLLAKKAEILEIVKSLSQTAAIAPVKGKEAPFHRTNVSDTNIAFFPAATFEDGGVSDISLTIMSPLGEALEWDINFPYALDDKAEPELIKTLDRALATPFVGFYKRLEYHPATLVAAKTFTGGLMVVDAILVELDQKAVVASCNMTAAPGDNLKFSSEDGQLAPDLMEMITRGDMEDKIAHRLGECIKHQTGGEFNFGA